MLKIYQYEFGQNVSGKIETPEELALVVASLGTGSYVSEVTGLQVYPGPLAQIGDYVSWWTSLQFWV